MHSSHRQRQDRAQQEYKDRYWFRYVKALYTPTDAIFQSLTTCQTLDMQTSLILFFTFAFVYGLRKLLAYRSAIHAVQ